MYIHITGNLAVHKEITKAGSVHLNKMNIWLSSLQNLEVIRLEKMWISVTTAVLYCYLVSLHTSFIHNMSTFNLS